MRVIISIFCGRKDRTSILLPYLDRLYAQGDIHEVHLWDYCRAESDREWFRSLDAPILYTCPSFKYSPFRPCQSPTFTYKFKVKSTSDILTLFVDQNGQEWELVIGGWGNTMSGFRRGQHTEPIAQTKSGEHLINTEQTTTDVSISWDASTPTVTVVVNGQTPWIIQIQDRTEPLNFVKVAHSSWSTSDCIWNVDEHPPATPYRLCCPLDNNTYQWNSHYKFYWKQRDTTYKDTIIVKCDDDIVAIDTDHFKDFIAFRKAHPEFLLVFPNIVNNGVAAYFQQNEAHVIPKEMGDLSMPPDGFCGNLWESAEICSNLHNYFLNNPSRFSYSSPEYHIIPVPIRFSINLFAILPQHLHVFEEAGTADDENYLTVESCIKNNMKKAIYTGMYVSHFSFYSQEAGMDVPGLLKRYAELANK